MKKVLITLMTVAAVATVQAQFTPYLNGEYTWRATYDQVNESAAETYNGKSVYEFTLEGDTIVNHMKYKKMYERALMRDGEVCQDAPKNLYMMLRDAAGIIYYLRNQGDTREVVLYDFLLEPDMSHMTHLCPPGSYQSTRTYDEDEFRTITFCKSRETVNICGRDYEAMNMIYIDAVYGEVYGHEQWIDGLGNSQGILFQSMAGLGYPDYEMFDKDGNLVFRSYRPELLVDGVLPPSAVQSAIADRPADGKRYRLDGTPASPDEDGLFVQDGRVHLNVR